MASDESKTPSGESPGRDELISAATGLFANHGYNGATTTAIAREAGVSQPLLYHHFGSKKGLWQAVTDELFGKLAEELQRVIASVEDTSRTERLTELLRAFVRFSGQNPELARLIRAESRGGGEAFDDLYERWLDDLVTFFNHELVAGQEDGTIRRLEPAQLYFIIVGAATEPFVQPEIARRTFGLDTADDAFIESYSATVVDALLNSMLRRL